MSKNSRIHPVILSGGAGERLWPLSRAHYPKQLLPLTSERTMLQETVRRVADPRLYAEPVIIANNEHRFIVAEQLQQIAVAPHRLILEPVGRNTAPAAALAAILMSAVDPDAVMALLPSDQIIQDPVALNAAMEMAAEIATSGALVAFGIRPHRPATSYGYIKRGAEFHRSPGAFRIAAFVEKPDLATAEAYVTSGGYDWNSGMFVFMARTYLEELALWAPEILETCRRSLAGSTMDLDFQRIDQATFTTCPGISIDYAVMEKTNRGVVVSGDFGWTDVGAWHAVWEVSQKDRSGNVSLGDCLLYDVEGSYLRSDDGRLIAAIGLRDMVVVSTDDAVMIAPRGMNAAVKEVVRELKLDGRKEAIHHRRIYRPWGSFKDIDRDVSFRVKRLVIKPGGKISLQKHKHRSEHWVVVDGTAKVTRGEEESLLYPNQSTYVPRGVAHRIENPGTEPVHIIEVQVGDYVEEDDIVRIDDVYGRVKEVAI